MDRYVTIYDWMLELGLKPCELIAYSVIWSFWTQGMVFTGSASYLAKWSGVKKKETVYKALSSLVSKGLVEKRERWKNGEKVCDYNPVQKTDQGSPKKGQGGGPKNGPGPYPKNGHHNNRSDSNRSDSDSDKKEYKEIVQLSLEEFRKSHR